MKAAQSQYDMAVNGARREDKLAAAAQVGRAKGAVQEVSSYINETVQIAQMEGEVMDIYPKQGELVGQGSPVMTVTDLSDIWFTFNIREDQLHGMNTGDILTLSVPALDGVKLQATVNYIAVRESYATWKATRETDQYDAKTFEVRAVPNETVEGLRPGMTVLVEK
jgi:HlyD family secretion protein